MEFIPHVIDNEERESVGKRCFDSINPASQEPWAQVAAGTTEDVAHAIAAARRAFDEGPWPRMGMEERGAILHRLADLIDEHVEELAGRDTADMGKPITDGRTIEVPRSARNFRFFADYARLRESEAMPSDHEFHVFVRYEPAGVIAAIAPWNLPLMLATWKIAPPLAWGNTVVLKPAEDTPASAALLGRLAAEAGMPQGVLNVLQGFGAGGAGQLLTESPSIDRITFTGESTTGRVISRAAADNLVPISLELGGKGSNIVFADSDLDEAVTWCLRSTFSNAGQVCLAGSRLYVQRELFDDFVDAFVAATRTLPVGDPMREETRVGPLASAAHHEKVMGYLNTVEADGGEILTGGCSEGWYVHPTVATGLSEHAAVCREEVFGPLATIAPFDEEQEAVGLANDTPYGLNAMVFTRDLSRAHRVSAALRVGTVWVNCFQVRDLRAPFGGVGESGVGREGGDHSREFCTEPKTVVMRV